MDQDTRAACEAIERAVAQGRDCRPFEIDANYLRGLELLEALPENQDGADKTWVFRAMRRYMRMIATARRV